MNWCPPGPVGCAGGSGWVVFGGPAGYGTRGGNTGEKRSGAPGSSTALGRLVAGLAPKIIHNRLERGTEVDVDVELGGGVPSV
jgi:hypothetical protein